MKIQPKNIQVMAPKTVTVSQLDDAHPFEDDCKNKRLTVFVNSSTPEPMKPSTCQLVVSFEGKEYDAFYTKYGDGWTSANLNEAICGKLGLTVAPSAPSAPTAS